jgi:UDP-N-acetyl-alpha-D-muramoyl-L-alanyl-L-glutamate epimerase
MSRAEVFHYVGFDLDPAAGVLTCDYAVDGRAFREEVHVPWAAGRDWSHPAVEAAARLVFLLTGISYYKTGAPPVIDLGEHALTAAERAFLLSYHLDGLGEFAHRNGIDLDGLAITGPELVERESAGYAPRPGRPLVPFGGGVDSITTVELLRERADDPALFVVNRPGDRFTAIERPAEVTGLPVVRAERVIDEQVLRSAELGFLNGHVPVTGILSAIAVLTAVLDGRDAVVMSNEWSASVGTIVVDGRSINHQYSKSLAFETGLRAMIASSVGDLDYFSALRPFTELWIARRFAELGQYFETFRSCNRVFHIDRALRREDWCGRCDKCCFIDLILAPFVDRDTLAGIFGGREGGREPLENTEPDVVARFEVLTGLSPDAKPWECVGDVTECQAAALLATDRPDRAGNPTLASIAARLGEAGVAPNVDGLLRPIGTHFIPRRYAADALLV